MKIYVTVPFFFTGQEGWNESQTSIVAGNAVLLADIQEHSANYLCVAEYESTATSTEIKRLISEGMKAAHQTAQKHMVQEFGDDWQARANYHFGNLQYNEIAELSREELAYLDS